MSGYGDGGASTTSNVLKSWHPRWMSAGSDIDLNMDRLRNRAADLARNTAMGAAAITTSARSVIGAGLKIYPRADHLALKISEADARTWNQNAAAEFALWSSTVDCDFYRRNNFGDLQYIAYTLYLTDGDCFCIFRRRLPTARNPYTLRLQLLEANRISTPVGGDGVTIFNPVEGKAANGNRIVNGIEVTEDGETAAIHVSNRVPNDLIGRDAITSWARVLAFGDTGFPNFLHIAHDIRSGQYRGVPYLASVIEPLKQMARYTTAELSSAIVKSFFSLFFVQPLENFDINEVLGKIPEAELDVSEYKLGSGTISALPRGVDVKSIDSNQSTAVFADFMTELTRQCGAALGIPAEVLKKSFNASYSASRAALLQANEEFRQRREWFIRDFMRPIWDQFLTEAIGTGRLKAPGFFDDPLVRAAWSAADYYGPSMPSLDPIKEIQAAALRVESGVSTWRREAAEMSGSDYEQNMYQRMREQMLKRRAGLK